MQGHLRWETRGTYGQTAVFATVYRSFVQATLNGLCLCPVEMLHNENSSGAGERYKTYK